MRYAKNLTLILITLTLSGWSTASFASGQRHLFDIADIQGLRNNQIVGYGLVVGLDGTGDRQQVHFTTQSMINMLQEFGVRLGDRANPRLRNVAAVTITAELLPQAGVGQRLDVTVSSIGDAKSLRGGTLLMTPLKGLDGQVYAVAQGNLVVGGIKAEGASGSSITVNTPTAGLIPNGAIIEREISSEFVAMEDIVLNLKTPNFKTARNIELAINDIFGPDVARAQGRHQVMISAPRDHQQRVTFMSMLEEVAIDTGRITPRVVFNSRTGTVVIGGEVKVRKAAVSHGSLTVTIVETQNVSQPNAFGNGRTAITPESDVYVDKGGDNGMFIWPEGTTLEVIVRAINSLGAAPDDLMSILQSLSAVGALDAELVVI